MNKARNEIGYRRQQSFVVNLIDNTRREEIKIPVDLCFNVLENKLLPSFKVYILMKMICSGKIRLNQDEKVKLAEFCGYNSVRSFNNHLNKLKEMNWIGYNKKSGYYHIRGFDYVQRKQSLTRITGFWFNIEDMRCFDATIYGAVIGYLSKYRGIMQRADQKKGRSNHTLCKAPGYFPVANLALSEILGVSRSTASLMKHRAEEEGYIEIKRKRLILPATPKYFDQQKRFYSEEYFKPIFIDHKLYIRFPDLVKPYLKYGRRRKKFDK